MKFCPYCGSELLGGTVAFCSECGKSIKGKNPKLNPKKTAKKEKKKKSTATSPYEPIPENEAFEESPTIINDGYDGYYDDVHLDDEGVERQGLDKEMIKNLIIIIIGVIVAISICVAAMYLM